MGRKFHSTKHFTEDYVDITTNTISDATAIVIGDSISFDSSESESFYSFSIEEASNILINGADANNTDITLRMYDADLNYIGNYHTNSSHSISLDSVGIYYIQAIDNQGGTFSIIDANSINATAISAGESISFDETAQDNFYSLTMTQSGSVLVEGSDTNGSHIALNIYDEELNYVGQYHSNHGNSLSLDTGIYYIQAIDSNGGTFSVTSADTIDATQIIDGETITFDETAEDNFYSVVVGDDTTFTVTGSDTNDNDITLKVYDENLNYIGHYHSNYNNTMSFDEAGTYYIQAIDSYGGTFTISTDATTTEDTYDTSDTDETTTEETSSISADTLLSEITGDIGVTLSSVENAVISNKVQYDIDHNTNSGLSTALTIIGLSSTVKTQALDSGDLNGYISNLINTINSKITQLDGTDTTDETSDEDTTDTNIVLTDTIADIGDTLDASDADYLFTSTATGSDTFNIDGFDSGDTLDIEDSYTIILGATDSGIQVGFYDVDVDPTTIINLNTTNIDLIEAVNSATTDDEKDEIISAVWGDDWLM